MKNNTKVIIALGAVLVLVLGIWFAVGRPPVEEPVAEEPVVEEPVVEEPVVEEPVAEEPVEEIEEVTMRFSWWGAPARHEKTKAVIDLFEERYPHITLEPEFGGWSGYWEKRALEATARELPDIFQTSFAWLIELVEGKSVIPLDPFIEAGTIDTTYIEDALLDIGRLDGELWGVNLGANTGVMIYDRELFEKAGVEFPDPNWTWDDFIQTSIRLHEALGIYGTGSMPVHGFQYYLRQHGYCLYSPDGTKLGYEDDSIFVSYFSMMMELLELGAMPGPAVWAEVSLGGPEALLIVDQRSAMDTTHSNINVAIVAAAGRELHIAMYPTLPGQVQEGLWIRPSQFLKIAANSEHPEEAAKFINFFTNDLEANEILLAERGVPISSKVMEHLKPLLSLEQKLQIDIIEKTSARADIPFPASPPWSTEVNDLLTRVTDMMALGEISLEDGATMFRAEANAIIAK